jgi:DHA1 family inner membrane transport protein
MSAPASGDRLPLFRLLVLSGAIFVSVSSEFLPTGLLPDIAADLNESESRVGLLVTLFAFTVAVSTAPLTLLTRRLSRKWLLVGLLGLFGVSNVLAAIAPTYELLGAARVVGGLAHGLFWAVTTPYIAMLVAPGQLAKAISITTAGGSFAFIIGVPFTAAIGHAVGWRAAFVVMAALVFAFALVGAITLPSVVNPRSRRHATTAVAPPARRDLSIWAVAIASMTVLLVATGHNLYYTYIAPWSIAVAGVPDDLVSVVLLFYGVAGAVGLLIAGALGDRHPRLLVNVLLVALVVLMIVAGAGARGLVLAVVLLSLWSVAFGGLPSLFHTRGLHSASARVRDLSGAVITTAFNLAIGGGALFGGLVFDHLGVEAVPYVGAAIVVVGLAWTVATDRARLRLHPADSHLG